MRLAFAIHAFAQSYLAQQHDGAGFQHAGANSLQHVAAGLPLQHDAVDAVAIENMGEQQPGRTGADDGDLGAHEGILAEHDLFGKPASAPGSCPRAGLFRIMLYPAIPIASTKARRTAGGWP